MIMLSATQQLEDNISDSNRIKSEKSIFRAAKSIKTGKLIILVQTVSLGRESGLNKDSGIKAYVGMPDEKLISLEISNLLIARDGGSIQAQTELGQLSIPSNLGLSQKASPFNVGYLGNVAISPVEIKKLALLESEGTLFATYNLPEVAEENEDKPSFRGIKT